jgi:hypothetical protein
MFALASDGDARIAIVLGNLPWSNHARFAASRERPVS